MLDAASRKRDARAMLGEEKADPRHGGQASTTLGMATRTLLLETDTHPRVFWRKSLELLENAGDSPPRRAKEFGRMSKQRG
jgi:hypothetical protein